MAKLLKNAVVSTEFAYLAQNTPAEVINFNLSTDNTENTQSSLSTEELIDLQNEAYKKGFIVGKEEGQSLSEQELADLKQQLHTTLQNIPQAIAHQRMEMSSEIADMVLHISQQLFLEKETNPQLLEAQINQLLTQLNSKQSIELHLHPKEIELLQQGLIQLEASHLNGLKIKSNDSLTLGGYLIKTEHGMFHAAVEKQIDQLKELLLQLRQGRQHAPVG